MVVAFKIRSSFFLSHDFATRNVISFEVVSFVADSSALDAGISASPYCLELSTIELGYLVASTVTKLNCVVIAA